MDIKSKIFSFIVGAGTVLTTWQLAKEPITNIYVKTSDAYRAMDEVKLVKGYHSELQSQINILRTDQIKIEEENDSLRTVIRFLEKGKHPYDSVHLLGKSGYWYTTTIESELHE